MNVKVLVEYKSLTSVCGLFWRVAHLLLLLCSACRVWS